MPHSSRAVGLFAFCVGLLGLLAVWTFILDHSATRAVSAPNGVLSLQLDALPPTAALQAKQDILTGISAAPDLAVFGNSRAVQIHAADLAVDVFGVGRTGINYAVPGTSFHNSTAFLEVLAKNGAAPKYAVISLDNLYLEFTGLPLVPGAQNRLSIFLGDFIALIGANDVGLRSKVRFVWRYLWNEWQLLKELLNAERIFAIYQPAQQTYLPDGTRPMRVAPAAGLEAPPGRAAPAIDPAYLDVVLQRLARIGRESGGQGGENNAIEILIVESPVHPDFYLGAEPDDRERALRSFVDQKCAAVGLTCFLGRNALQVNWPTGWGDHTHAPTDALTSALADRMREVGAK